MCGAIELDRLAVIGDGAIVISLGIERLAAVDVSGCVFGVEADRSIVISDRLIGVAPRIESVAASDIGRASRVELDCAIAISDGEIGLPVGGIRRAAVLVGPGEALAKDSARLDQSRARLDSLARRKSTRVLAARINELLNLRAHWRSRKPRPAYQHARKRGPNPSAHSTLMCACKQQHSGPARDCRPDYEPTMTSIKHLQIKRGRKLRPLHSLER